MGRHFWVGCGCFFLEGRGRGRGTPGHDCRGVFAGRREFQTSLFMLYIICWAVEVSMLDAFQDIAKSALDLDDLGRHVRCSSFDNPSTCSTHWRQWRGCCTSFRHGLHGAVGMVFYAHAVSVTCYFCYMFSLGPSSGRSGSVRIYRRVIFGKQNWWCAWTPCT